MKIGQYLAKIWTRVQYATFFETRCSSASIGATHITSCEKCPECRLTECCRW